MKGGICYVDSLYHHISINDVNIAIRQ